MNIAKISRADHHVTVELPLGVEFNGERAEVVVEGRSLRLIPLGRAADEKDRFLAFLDELERSQEEVDESFVKAIEEIEAADTASAQSDRAPSFD